LPKTKKGFSRIIIVVILRGRKTNIVSILVSEEDVLDNMLKEQSKKSKDL